MEKLMQIAKKYADKVELYSIEENTNSISFENARLKDTDTKFQSGIGIRIIKEGKVGVAYTKNLIDREELVKNALNSLKGGVQADFDLPLTKDLSRLNTYDPSVEELSNTVIVEECKRICKNLTSKTKGQVNIYAGSGIAKIRLLNSRGTDLSTETSYYYCVPMIMYPGGYSAIERAGVYKKFERFSDDYLNYIINTYNSSTEEKPVKTGRMKVLFLPESVYVLKWRLSAATSGKSLYEKQSPISEKLGERLFSEKLNIYNDPLDDERPVARNFDDEGVCCQYLSVVEEGVLKNFYYDLNYASKMKKRSTGNGFRSARWGGDTITINPNPSLSHLLIKPGNTTFNELLKMMNRGVIVAGALGAHSGNIPNGDFSIGLSPGLLVENGKIVGHLKDTMIAGNIYEVMKNVIAIEDTAYQAQGGKYPSILFDDVSVATKL